MDVMDAARLNIAIPANPMPCRKPYGTRNASQQNEWPSPADDNVFFQHCSQTPNLSCLSEAMNKDTRSPEFPQSNAPETKLRQHCRKPLCLRSGAPSRKPGPELMARPNTSCLVSEFPEDKWRLAPFHPLNNHETAWHL